METRAIEKIPRHGPFEGTLNIVKITTHSYKILPTKKPLTQGRNKPYAELSIRQCEAHVILPLLEPTDFNLRLPACPRRSLCRIARSAGFLV